MIIYQLYKSIAVNLQNVVIIVVITTMVLLQCKLQDLCWFSIDAPSSFI